MFSTNDLEVHGDFCDTALGESAASFGWFFLSVTLSNAYVLD